MVLGVFLEVAQFTRFGDGLADLRAQHALQVFHFFFQGAGAWTVMGNLLMP